MNHRKKANHSPKNGSPAKGAINAKSASVGIPNHVDAILSRVIRHISVENYQKALDLLRSAGSNPQLRNALGVCLLRLGRFEDAIRVLRDLALAPGCTWVRPEGPTVYKVNFATALLLGGHPAGCQEILSETRDATHPAVQRLHAAIKRWEAGLPLRKRLLWRFGRIEPSNCPVTLDFPAGDFDVVVTSPDVSMGTSQASASQATAL